MIISGQKALNLVSNHSILQAVPELLGPVEAFQSATRKWRPKKDCPNCDKAAFYAPVEELALLAIAGLSGDAAARFKKFIGRNEVFVNVPQPGKPAIVKEVK